jgi:MFS family permease
LEGFPSVLIAAVAWRVIPDSPQTAAYLTPREKKVATLRLRRENPGKSSNPTSGLVGRDVLAVLRDPIAWVTAAMFFLTNMAYSSLPVFLPTILLEMGHDALSAQALSAPPYLVSFVLVLVLAHVSDRARDRSLLIALLAIQSALGYAVLALAEWLHISPVIRYLAVYLAAAGFFNVVTLTVVWNLNNQASESRQGGGFALMQLVGQCGPLVGTRLYPDVEGPFYTRGMKACAWAMFAVAVLAILLRFYMIRLNARAERADAAAEAVPLAEEEGLVGSGAKRRTRRQGFRYML